MADLNEYWQEEEPSGMICLGSKDDQAELFWQLHTEEEAYVERPIDDLGLHLSSRLADVPSRASGTRIYLHAKPFIWEPRIILTVALGDEPTERTPLDSFAAAPVIGRVVASDESNYERLYVGMGQAYYYPRDRTIALWECLADHWTKQETSDLDEGAFFVTLWQRFEALLLRRFPEAQVIVTPGWEPKYDGEVWRSFLTRQGYAQDQTHPRTFRKMFENP